MITLEFESPFDWMKARDGKVTGSTVKNFGFLSRGSNKGEMKEHCYSVIAGNLLDTSYQDNTIAMSDRDRGNFLEPIALDLYGKKYGVAVFSGKRIWQREDNPLIAISPDGYTLSKNGDRKGVEAKCLSSSKHVRAIMTNKVPDDYWEQVLQYFIVDDEMKEIDFILYDPRLIGDLKLHVITIKRIDILNEIDEQRERIEEALKPVEEAITMLRGRAYKTN